MNMIHELYELRLFTQKKDTKKEPAGYFQLVPFLKIVLSY